MARHVRRKELLNGERPLDQTLVPES